MAQDKKPAQTPVVEEMTMEQLEAEIARTAALEAAARVDAEPQLARASTTGQVRVRVNDGSAPSIQLGRAHYTLVAGQVIFMHPGHALELEQIGAVTRLSE